MSTPNFNSIKLHSPIINFLSKTHFLYGRYHANPSISSDLLASMQISTRSAAISTMQSEFFSGDTRFNYQQALDAVELLLDIPVSVSSMKGPAVIRKILVVRHPGHLDAKFGAPDLANQLPKPQASPQRDYLTKKHKECDDCAAQGCCW